MPYLKHFILCLISSLLFSCGGGSGGGNDDDNTTLLSGLFLDAPVNGLTYVATPSNQEGTTQNGGLFNYREGDSVTFSLGNLKLGTAKPVKVGTTNLITPQTLADNISQTVDKEKVTTLILQTLQSVNENTDADTGIRVNGNDFTNIHQSIAEFTTNENALLAKLPDHAKNNNQFKITAAVAKQHFRKFLYKEEHGEFPKIDLKITSTNNKLSSDNPSTTLTFTFDKVVENFNIDAIKVSDNVVKSSFSIISPSIYNLVINAKDNQQGNVKIEVIADETSGIVGAVFYLLIDSKPPQIQSNFSFNETSVQKTYGETFSRVATAGQSSNKTISYTSSAPDIATVNSQGTLTLLKAGVTNIQAKQLGDNIYAPIAKQYQLTVVKKSQTGFSSGNDKNISFVNNATYTQVATGGQSTLNIHYQSSNTGVASVDNNGKVTIKTIGTTTITAERPSDDKYLVATDSYLLSVLTPNDVPRFQSDFSFNETSVQKTYGETFSRVATTGQSSDKTISYTSSTPDIATVNSQGVLTLLKAGVTHIQAKQLGDNIYAPITKQYQLTVVKKSQTGFSSGNDKNISFINNATYTQVATGGQSTLNIHYQSSNTGVASVDNNGKVTIKTIGTTTITAERPSDDKYLVATDSYLLSVSASDNTPIQLELTQATSNSVVLNWSSVNNAEGYTVHFAKATFLGVNANNYSLLDAYNTQNSTATTTTIRDLDDDARYFFIITANGNGISNHTSNQSVFDSIQSDFNQTLRIPAQLNPIANAAGVKAFNLYLKKGQYEFYTGTKTQVFYGDENATNIGNTQYLLPTLRMTNGDKISITYHNKLAEKTTMHGHGMHIPANQDGGPVQQIIADSSWTANYTVNQKASTNWYHPHLSGKTGEQVYKGLAGMIIIDDAESQALDLPKTYGVDDFPIIVQNKRFDTNKQLLYNLSNQDIMRGFQGDVHMVNGVIKAFLNVPAKQIRLRLLNASNASMYDFGFVKGKSFQQIASEQALLESPVTLTKVLLSPAERAEIVIDFSQDSGKNFILKDFKTGAELLQIKVGASTSQTIIPSTLTHLPKLSPIGAATRNFDLGGNMGGGMGGNRGGGNGNQSPTFTINNQSFDMSRIDTIMTLNTTEVWTITNKMPITHNFHLHATHFRIIERNGNANNVPANERGYKDTVRIDGNQTVKFIVKMIDYTTDSNSPYMYHCHILEHEDNGMMGTFIVQE